MRFVIRAGLVQRDIPSIMKTFTDAENPNFEPNLL